MQNIEIAKAIPWNPWHGCKKVSQGCKNCFVYKMNQRYGRGKTKIEKEKTTYELKDKNCSQNLLVKLCFSSDFFIEEADEWRDGCWDNVHIIISIENQEMAPTKDVRPIKYEWVESLYKEVHERILNFTFIIQVLCL